MGRTDDGPIIPVPHYGPEDFVGLTIGFFDIETTYSTQPRLLCGAIADAWGNVEVFDRNSYPGKNRLIDDSQMALYLAKRLSKYDILVGWNSKLFDVPVINGRLAYHGIGFVLEPKMHLDLMYYASGQFMRIGRRSLESVSTYFGTDAQKTPLGPILSDRAVTGDEEAYQLLIEHNVADVLTTREVFVHLKQHVRNIHR